MFDQWIPLTQNLEKQGAEGGVILQDEELSGVARVTVERQVNLETRSDYYAVTIGVYGYLVHTAFFSTIDDAKEAAGVAKLLAQVLGTK